MSYGKMNCFVELVSTEQKKDAQGFAQSEDKTLANIRAYREDRHGTESWANRAAFSTATALFRFRKIPGVVVDTSQYLVCADGRYRVLSVEDVKGRGMYHEALAEKIEPTKR